jgi:hypothetical protein
MKLQILKSFRVANSPRPFVAGELVDVPETTAKQWIADGSAIEFAGGNAKAAEEAFHLASKPAAAGSGRQRNREKAVTTS